MRTTIDLPEDILRAAKTRAAERDESLKELFARAVAREIGLPPGRPAPRRVTFPLVGDASGPPVDVTNADIEAALSTEDAERYASR